MNVMSMKWLLGFKERFLASSECALLLSESCEGDLGCSLSPKICDDSLSDRKNLMKPLRFT